MFLSFLSSLVVLASHASPNLASLVLSSSDVLGVLVVVHSLLEALFSKPTNFEETAQLSGSDCICLTLSLPSFTFALLCGGVSLPLSSLLAVSLSLFTVLLEVKSESLSVHSPPLAASEALIVMMLASGISKFLL